VAETGAGERELKLATGEALEYESRSAEGQMYRLGRRLEAGSTGDVFETSHPLLPGPCAIKVLRPELVDGTESLEAFRADLEAVSALRHPNIVQVIEVGAMPGVPPFVVMELLEGRLLAEQLAGHRTLPLDEVVEIVKAVAAALQAAHSRGVVHGELNPGNVFLARVEGYDRGVVKLLNFGIHRLRRVDAAASLTSEATRYLSPEQAAGRADDIDGRSDQFALAALTYRMLSGVDSFPGESAISLLYQIVHDQPAIDRPPDVSEDVEAVIRRGLVKDRGARFESVVAFARAFESAAKGSADAPAAQPPPVAAGNVRIRPVELGARAQMGGRAVDAGAMTMRGFAASRSPTDRGGAREDAPPAQPRHLPPAREPAPARPPDIAAQRPEYPVAAQRPVFPAQRPVFPAQRPVVPAQRAAAPQPREPAPRRAPSSFRLSPSRPRADKVDSLLMEPFFAAYRDDHHRRGDTMEVEAELMERPPRHGWKLMLFLIAVGIGSVAASLAVGWRPPLAWRQSTVWRELRLPGAASPAMPSVELRTIRTQ
jgi:hypothetical protein